MSKKNKIILIILSMIILLLVVGLVLLKNFGNDEVLSNDKLKLTCDSEEISMKKEVICSLKGNITDDEVSAFSSNLEISNSNYQITDVKVDEIWEGDGEDGDIELYTDENKKGEFNVLSFKVSLKDDSTSEIIISLVDNSYFDKDYEMHKLGDINKILTVRK